MVAAIFLSIFFIFNLILPVSIDLQLQNIEKSNNKNIAYVGQIFQIKVSVLNVGQDTNKVEVNGLEKLIVSGKSQSTSISVLNNRMLSQTDYLFDVFGQDEGVLEIGPAYIEQDGKRIESNTLALQLKKEFGGGHICLSDGIEVFCKLNADTDKVFVGQPVVLTASIYTKGNILQLSISTPKFKDFLVSEIEQVSKYQQSIEDSIFNVAEKKYLIFPMQHGLHEVNPLSAEFTVPIHRSRPRGFFDDDFLAGFGGFGVEKKRALSNGLKIDVKPLPKYEKVVDVVGQFNKFDINVDKNEATVNEPIMLKLELEGKGNLQQISYPKLNLPSFCKSYDSKFELKQDLRTDYNGGNKLFEYVLQVGRDGVFKIPPQKLTYFDTNSHSYKTLATKEIELKINPCQEESVYIAQNDLSNNLNESEGTRQQKKVFDRDINFISEDNIEDSHELNFPFWMFAILLLLPVLIFTRKMFLNIYEKIKIKYFSSFLHKKTLSEFNKKLDQIIKKDKVAKLYQFYIKYFATKFLLPTHLITQDLIAKKLFSSSLPEDKVEEFLDYLNLCASYHFSSKKDAIEEKKYLLEKAKYWFLLLNK